MLINVSNHPHEQWGEVQKQNAIKLWGAIKDIAFPSINPELSREELLPMVEDFFNQCQIEALKYGPDTVFHVAGEHVFCFHLVGHLLQSGYSVVASTTERIISYQADGAKISRFQFVRFRYY